MLEEYEVYRDVDLGVRRIYDPVRHSYRVVRVAALGTGKYPVRYPRPRLAVMVADYLERFGPADAATVARGILAAADTDSLATLHRSVLRVLSSGEQFVRLGRRRRGALWMVLK